MSSKLNATMHKILEPQANTLKHLEKKANFRRWNEQNGKENILSKLCRLLKNLYTVYIFRPFTS